MRSATPCSPPQSPPVAPAAALVLTGTSCARPTVPRPPPPLPPRPRVAVGAVPLSVQTSPDWESVLAQAQGQTVNWYMYGGDDTLNAFVTGYVADALAEAGVTLNQVRITDTVDAVNKVLGEVQAGRTTAARST